MKTRKRIAMVAVLAAFSLVLGLVLSTASFAAIAFTEKPHVTIKGPASHVIPNPALITITGRITSNHPECRINRIVRMYTGDNGKGFVGSDKSGGGGTFSISTFADRNHTYHVEVAGGVVDVHPDTGVCLDAKSNYWRVRVKKPL